ncbi:MAG: TolC family protein [Chlamydiota bacterium]
MPLVIFLLTYLVMSCNPVKEPPLLPLSPCIPSVRPSPPPKSSCPIYPVKDQASSLSELVDISLHNHPLTKEAWSQARAASASVTISESSYYPTLDLDIEGNQQRFSNFANIGGTGGGTTLQPIGVLTYYDIVLSLTYLLWDFGGGRQSGVLSAKETLCSSAWNYSWTIQSVIINVVSSYWDTIRAKSDVEATTADLKDAQTLLDVSIAKKRAGLATYVDVSQSQANFVKAELKLVAAQGLLENSQAALATSMGLAPNTPLLLAKPHALEPTALSQDLDRLLARTKCCRADLTSLKAALKAQAYNVDVQKSKLYPSLNASLIGAKIWYKGTGGGSGLDYSGTIDLHYPLFTGFNITGSIKQAEAQLDQMAANYQYQELTALLNVNNSYTSTVTSLESFKYAKEYLIYAGDSFAANLTGYKNGTKSIVDVISAETTLSDARSQLVDSETTYYRSLANLAYTSGLLVSQEVVN